MSYKQEFQSNNADLQNIISLVNNLPEAENLESELATQDDLIAQIAATLEDKISGDSGGNTPLYSCIATLDVFGGGFFGFFDINGNEIPIDSYHSVDLSNFVGQLIYANGSSDNLELMERFDIWTDDEMEVHIPILEEYVSGSGVALKNYNWFFVVPKYNIYIYHDIGSA